LSLSSSLSSSSGEASSLSLSSLSSSSSTATHAWPTQTWLFVEQSVQVAPSVPQSASAVPRRHQPVVVQQPFGHVDALHASHTPLTQVSSESAQSTHVAPVSPHSACSVPDTQMSLRQQPVGHKVLLQPGDVPCSHCWLVHNSPLLAQFWHCTPPVPQRSLSVPTWQAPSALQQPVGQVVASHGAHALL
jgi:hypothetical protein